MKFPIVIFVWVLLNGPNAFAIEQDSVTQKVQLNMITVSAFKDEPANETSLNITSINIDSARMQGNFQLTDILAKNPGVTMLSSGVSIAKPVIRGLYGNRILVLLSGLKFDNQQWQDEHGMGLSDFGLDRVELIKGPLSVQYGSEALGGVINLIEELKPALGTKQRDIYAKFNSNTLGGTLGYGFKQASSNKWMRIRFAVENNADYTDGGNKRVVNSRFDGYYFKYSTGVIRKNSTSVFHYMSTFNRFGFINDLYHELDSNESRYSRKLNVNPAHLVLLNIFASENKWYLKNHYFLKLNYGLQSNRRMENEGGGAISLDMHLLTLQYIARLEKQFSEKHKMVLSNLLSMENNTNYGARKIVPDANMRESNISLYDELNFDEKIIVENGLSVGEKYIKTLPTVGVNSVEKDIVPFTKNSLFSNLYSGVTLNKTHLNVKLNISTGVRMPNLAELSSNGLHEGVFNYELGNPNLKNERSISANMYCLLSYPKMEITVSPFYNYFYNYVYLAPAGREWYGFPVYLYLQQNAKQYGGEANVSWKIQSKWRLQANYSGMVSMTSDGKYTPFNPAQKSSQTLVFNPVFNKVSASFFVSNDYVFEQTHLYQGETKTPSYLLQNIGCNFKAGKPSFQYQISISVNNLTNKKYYDHLSRLKNLGVYNIGRNIALTLKINF
jgi:iron complex outermembrane receptor protein